MGDEMADEYLRSHPEATPRLNAALAKAQGAIENAKKDVANPFFNTKYADLAGIIDACRKPLADNGLAIVQLVLNDANGVTVTTRLLHSSGESIDSACWVPVVKKDPQGYGSAMTYARRFGLQALVGVAAEFDDDGNSHAAIDADALTAKDYTKKKKPLPPELPTKQPVNTDKLVAAFAGLGVTVAALESIVKKPLSAFTADDCTALKAEYAAKKKMATESPDDAAKRIEQEALAKAVAETRKLVDEISPSASAGPINARDTVFQAILGRIRSSVSAAEVTLSLAVINTATPLTDGDKKALQRSAADRIFIINDAEKQKIRKSNTTIEDVF